MNLTKSETDFWSLIDETIQQVASNDIADELTNKLSSMEDVDILSFKFIYDKLCLNLRKNTSFRILYYLSYSNSVCMTFSNFCSWIISSGKENYYMILENPDNFADCLKLQNLDILDENIYENYLNDVFIDVFDIKYDDLMTDSEISSHLNNLPKLKQTYPNLFENIHIQS